MKYRPEIDGLRALAVLPVILFHAGFDVFSGGFVGVDIFFVISGYLITSILVADLEKGNFSLLEFYERRARRILPALLTVCFVTIPFACWLLTPRDILDFSQSLMAVAGFSSNFLFWLESGYFDRAAELKPLLHTWSLAVEEQYYIIFPIFLMLFWRFGKMHLIVTLTFIFVVSIILAQIASHYRPVANFYLLPMRGWEILLGAFAAFYLRQKKLPALSKPLPDVLSISGLLLILFAVFFFSEKTPFPGFYGLVPTLGAVLIILFADQTTYIYKVLSHRFFVGVGLVSYSAYLWHHPIFAFTKHMLVLEPAPVLMLALSIISFVPAYFSWKYIERPFRDRKNFPARKSIPILVAGLLAVFLLGLYGTVQKGTLPIRNEQMAVRMTLIENLEDQRQENIRAGICHYNKNGTYKDYESFAENWSCPGNDEKELKTTNIGIFGDSHSADIAAALRLAGFDAVQMGGANCPLSKTYMHAQRSYCYDLFDKFRAQRDINTVILSNRYDESTLTADYLKNVFDSWAPEFKQVILFSPMPDFTIPHKEFLKYGKATLAPSFEKHDQFFENLKRITIPPNVVVMNTAEILCGQDLQCPFEKDGEIYYTDKDHFSETGSAYFGSRLTETPEFKVFARK